MRLFQESLLEKINISIAENSFSKSRGAVLMFDCVQSWGRRKNAGKM